MICRKVICDRCNKVIIDSESKLSSSDLLDAMFGKQDAEIGYAEINICTINGKCSKQLHFCEDCYDIAVNALNS